MSWFISDILSSSKNLQSCVRYELRHLGYRVHWDELTCGAPWCDTWFISVLNVHGWNSSMGKVVHHWQKRFSLSLSGSHYSGCSLAIREFTMKNSPADVQQPVNIFYSDEEPLSKYSPVMLHVSPATRILNNNPALLLDAWSTKGHHFFFCIIPLCKNCRHIYLYIT